MRTLLNTLLWLLSRLPLRASRWLGRGVANLVWWASAGPARITRRNLAIAYPDMNSGERELLGRRSLQHTAMLMMESGVMAFSPEVRWRGLIERIEGLTELQTMLESRTEGGVLVLAPHLGNWEIISLILGPLGVTALYDPPRQPGFEAVLKKARERTGATLVPIGPPGIRRLYRALRGGGLVAVLPDQVPEREAGLYVPFFAHPTLTMSFAHRVIVKTGCVPVLGYVVRTRTGFEVRFQMLAAKVSDKDALTSMTAMNAAIETAVRRYPEQYQWEYKRFKGQPRGEPGVYD